MTDIVVPAVRSRMMAGIRDRNTKPEKQVRSYLHAAGFRFRLHDRTLAGRPDIVLRKFNAVVFVHGCFWHQHEGCTAAAIPSSNKSFWRKKFKANQQRDKKQVAALLASGWRVGVFWECAARKGIADERALQSIAIWLKQRSGFREFSAAQVRSRPEARFG